MLAVTVVVVVTQGAEGGQEGRHDHHHGDDGGDQRVRGPLVGVDGGVLRTYLEVSSDDDIRHLTVHLDSMVEPNVCALNT